MSTLTKTSTGFKLNQDEIRTVKHSDGEWVILKENQNVYLLSQKELFTVRTKDKEGRVGFYTGDSSSRAYDVYQSIGLMELSKR